MCHGNSIWDTYSDYSECKEQCPVDPYMSGSGLNITWEDCTYQHDIADISEIIYYIGSNILCSIYNLQVSKLNWHHNKNKLYNIIYSSSKKWIICFCRIHNIPDNSGGCYDNISFIQVMMMSFLKKMLYKDLSFFVFVSFTQTLTFPISQQSHLQ